MGVSENRGKNKMDGENNGNPYEQMDDLGGKPTILGNTRMFPCFQWLRRWAQELDFTCRWCLVVQGHKSDRQKDHGGQFLHDEKLPYFIDAINTNSKYHMDGKEKDFLASCGLRYSSTSWGFVENSLNAFLVW